MSQQPTSFVPPARVCSGYTPIEQVGEVAATAQRYVGGHAALPQLRLHLEMFDNKQIVIRNEKH